MDENNSGGSNGNKKFDFKGLAGKNMTNLYVVVLILIFVLLAINVFAPNITTSNKKEPEKNIATAEESEIKNTINNYEENQKNELVGIIKRMQGVGEVRVMMTFEGGEERIPAIDSNTQTTVTEETDKEGGKRENKQTTDGMGTS